MKLDTISSKVKLILMKLKRPEYYISAIIAVVVVLGLAGYFGRSWVRFHLMPATASILYMPSVKHTAASERAALNDPFRRLSFTTSTTDRNCALQVAQKLHSTMDCSYEEQAYTKLPKDAAAAAKVQAETAMLQADLSAHGWHGGTNGVTLTSLVSGTAHGVDYSPDAFYEKVVGKYTCIFDTFIAYSNPQPPAIRSVLTCDRTVSFFGKPSLQTYDSSKGFF
jgi:hypothetical protein